jgi:hypothetical protein
LTPSLCQNGGTCTNDNVGGYTCACVSGYTGTNCVSSVCYFKSENSFFVFLNFFKIKAYPCITSPPCVHGTCADGSNSNYVESGYVCTCTYGYAGVNCQYGKLLIHARYQEFVRSSSLIEFS